MSHTPINFSTSDHTKEYQVEADKQTAEINIFLTRVENIANQLKAVNPQSAQLMLNKAAEFTARYLFASLLHHRSKTSQEDEVSNLKEKLVQKENELLKQQLKQQQQMFVWQNLLFQFSLSQTQKKKPVRSSEKQTSKPSQQMQQPNIDTTKAVKEVKDKQIETKKEDPLIYQSKTGKKYNLKDLNFQQLTKKRYTTEQILSAIQQDKGRQIFGMRKDITLHEIMTYKDYGRFEKEKIREMVINRLERKADAINTMHWRIEKPVLVSKFIILKSKFYKNVPTETQSLDKENQTNEKPIEKRTTLIKQKAQNIIEEKVKIAEENVNIKAEEIKIKEKREVIENTQNKTRPYYTLSNAQSKQIKEAELVILKSEINIRKSKSKIIKAEREIDKTNKRIIELKTENKRAKIAKSELDNIPPETILKEKRVVEPLPEKQVEEIKQEFEKRCEEMKTILSTLENSISLEHIFS